MKVPGNGRGEGDERSGPDSRGGDCDLLLGELTKEGVLGVD